MCPEDLMAGTYWWLNPVVNNKHLLISEAEALMRTRVII